MSLHYAVLLLGSNLGNTTKNLDLAKEKILNRIGCIVKETNYLYNKAVEFESEQIFCNFALKVQTELSPIRLLQELKAIEVEMGREKDSKASGGYQDRIIDIDIVSFENLRFESSRLTLPHEKHLYHRDFSRVLLKELDSKSRLGAH